MTESTNRQMLIASLPTDVLQASDFALHTSAVPEPGEGEVLCRTLAAIRPHPVLRSLPRRTVETLVPRATYRLQFHKDFDFDDAIAILPYLARLGVSHVYCSPIQRARPGSMHGYDVVAHDEINPELGGREGFERFTAVPAASSLSACS